MREKKWADLSPNQRAAARRYAEKFGMTTSQAGKYLDWCFALQRCEITAEAFTQATGHTPKAEPQA